MWESLIWATPRRVHCARADRLKALEWAGISLQLLTRSPRSTRCTGWIWSGLRSGWAADRGRAVHARHDLVYYPSFDSTPKRRPWPRWCRGCRKQRSAWPLARQKATASTPRVCGTPGTRALKASPIRRTKFVASLPQARRQIESSGCLAAARRQVYGGCRGAARQRTAEAAKPA